MAETLIEQLAGHGVLGLLLALLGWRYHLQSRELSEVQAARVKDAQQVAETHLAIQDQQRWVISELTEAVKRLRPPSEDTPGPTGSAQGTRSTRR